MKSVIGLSLTRVVLILILLEYCTDMRVSMECTAQLPVLILILLEYCTDKKMKTLLGKELKAS